jgi:hypothetical protein
LGFLNWSELETYLSNEPEKPISLFHQSDFPIPLLKLALVTENAKLFKKMLDEYDFIKQPYIRFKIANMLGSHLRQTAYEGEIIQILAKHPQGRCLFFETYVDEDNSHGQFSKVLNTYYLSPKKELSEHLFVTCYTFTQEVYAGSASIESFPSNLFSFIYDSDFFFHHTSRLWECFFLYHLEHLQIREVHQHLDQMLKYAEPFSKSEKSWLLARMIRAFLFHQKEEWLLLHKDYMDGIASLVKDALPYHHSIAEYFIQALLLKDSRFRIGPDQLRYTPEHDFFNESHHKALLDTFFLACTETNLSKKKWMLQQMEQAGNALHKRWISGLLSMD